MIWDKDLDSAIAVEVRRKELEMSIIAAVDGSPVAKDVLARAIEQARQSGSTLHVVHVFQPPTVVYGMAGAYIFEERELEEAEQKAVWETVEPQLADAGIEWVRADLSGYPPAIISEYARDVGARLIVVGTRGRGNFASLVLGSTSHGVIHDSPCDVLVVKPTTTE
jgi:nucleotide-binding universal stress UspA family protein